MEEHNAMSSVPSGIPADPAEQGCHGLLGNIPLEHGGQDDTNQEV